MQNSHFFALFLMFLTVAGLTATTHATSNSNLVSGFATIAPTIDGVIQPGEWASAGTVDFKMNPDRFLGTIYVMNDASNIYIAFVIRDSSLAGRTLSIWFDNNHTGTLVVGDDWLTYSTYNPPGIFDAYILNVTARVIEVGFDQYAGGTNDGSVNATSNGSFNVYEFSHPLCSADRAHDFCLHSGSIVGFDVQYTQPSSSAGPGAYGFWPKALNNNGKFQDTMGYGTILIA